MLDIQKIRTKHAISKYEVCKKAGIDFHTLAKIENGGDVKLSTLYKIAEALGVDVVDLFERSTNNGKG